MGGECNAKFVMEGVTVCKDYLIITLFTGSLPESR